jgi:long-chain acyl-CoA synthetase
VGNRYALHQRQGVFYRLQLALARKLVFKKWRAALGGRVQAVVTGSAACQVRLLRLFTAAQIIILEGYGLTETSPVISVNRMEPEDRMFGTVGPIIQGVEVRIAEDGEILCKGPSVMMGYYCQPELTAEALAGGWFHTGDLGEMVAGRFLKIVDRKKELFKTSGGKYVAPQPIENKMQESPFIESIMVVGVNRKFPAALIVPRDAYLSEWCRRHRVAGGSLAEMIRRPEVIERIKKEVNRYNPLFSHVEQIKKIALVADPWTVEGGELSPTLKLKRKVILTKYAALIDQIYQE